MNDKDFGTWKGEGFKDIISSIHRGNQKIFMSEESPAGSAIHKKNFEKCYFELRLLCSCGHKGSDIVSLGFHRKENKGGKCGFLTPESARAKLNLLKRSSPFPLDWDVIILGRVHASLIFL